MDGLREGLNGELDWRCPRREEALYFSRLIRLASRSYLSRITQLPVYPFMTIRNWNTTTKLLGLIELGDRSVAAPPR